MWAIILNCHDYSNFTQYLWSQAKMAVTFRWNRYNIITVKKLFSTILSLVQCCKKSTVKGKRLNCLVHLIISWSWIRFDHTSVKSFDYHNLQMKIKSGTDLSSWNVDLEYWNIGAPSSGNKCSIVQFAVQLLNNKASTYTKSVQYVQNSGQ